MSKNNKNRSNSGNRVTNVGETSPSRLTAKLKRKTFNKKKSHSSDDILSSSQSQGLGPPKKAWEFHYRSFLSRSGTSGSKSDNTDSNPSGFGINNNERSALYARGHDSHGAEQGSKPSSWAGTGSKFMQGSPPKTLPTVKKTTASDRKNIPSGSATVSANATHMILPLSQSDKFKSSSAALGATSAENKSKVHALPSLSSSDEKPSKSLTMIREDCSAWDINDKRIHSYPCSSSKSIEDVPSGNRNDDLPVTATLRSVDDVLGEIEISCQSGKVSSLLGVDIQSQSTSSSAPNSPGKGKLLHKELHRVTAAATTGIQSPFKKKSSPPKQSSEIGFKKIQNSPPRHSDMEVHASSIDTAIRGGSLFKNMFKSPKSNKAHASKNGIHDAPLLPNLVSGGKIKHKTRSCETLDDSLRRGSSRTRDNSTRLLRATSSGAFPQSLKKDLIKTSSVTSTTNNAGRHDSAKKKIFTQFHNSGEFGKDSTSAFLGDETSIRSGRLFVNSYDGVNANAAPQDSAKNTSSNNIVTIKTGRRSDLSYSAQANRAKQSNLDYSSPCSISSSPLSVKIDEKNLPPSSSTTSSHPEISQQLESETVSKGHLQRSSILTTNEDNRTTSSAVLLNPLSRQHKPLTHDANGMIAPMVLAMCPFSLMPFPSHLTTNSDNCSSKGLTMLGRAKASIVSVNSANEDWSTARFVLYNNFLLEYEDQGACGQNSKLKSKPIGYAHLQQASIEKDDNTIELEFDDGAKSLDTKTNSFGAMARRRKKVVFQCSSPEESAWWVFLLKHASTLTMYDLYQFNCSNPNNHLGVGGELGTGRYATIRAARRRLRRLVRAVNSSGEVFTDDNCYGDYNCALKIISKHQFQHRVNKNREREDTLLREVAIQSSISLYASDGKPLSEPLLQLKGFFETQTLLVLELELLESKDLFSYVSSKQGSSQLTGRCGLSEFEASLITRNLLQSITALHELGIAHRDIKPANLLMCSDSPNVRVKLADYGMAAFVGEDGLIRGRCGTPGYVAPEILSAGVRSGYRNKVDIFSAGVTLYVMLCGYEPFYGENDAQLVAANKLAKIDFPESEWGTVSDDAKHLVQRMMEPDAETRINVEDALQHPWILRHQAPLCPSLGQRKVDDDDGTLSCVVS